MASDSQSGARQRGPGRAKSPVLGISSNDDELKSKIAKQKLEGTGPYKKASEAGYRLWLVVVTLLAGITRFWKINHPDQVVFDEVHFGKVCD